MSWRGMARGRSLVAIAYRTDGEGVEGFALRAEVDEEGSFDDESDVKNLALVTKFSGYAFLTWWRWPQDGPGRDLTSIVRLSWDDPDVAVMIENDDG
jgi:hypothetical protein